MRYRGGLGGADEKHPAELVDIAHFYGRDPELVLAGGGNTSYKTPTHSYIKALEVGAGRGCGRGWTRSFRRL